MNNIKTFSHCGMSRSEATTGGENPSRKPFARAAGIASGLIARTVGEFDEFDFRRHHVEIGFKWKQVFGPFECPLYCGRRIFEFSFKLFLFESRSLPRAARQLNIWSLVAMTARPFTPHPERDGRLPLAQVQRL